jgi:hypothetical protein
MIFSVCILKKFEIDAQGFWKLCNWALLSRAVAIPVMLLLPTVSLPHSPIRREFALSDTAALLTMLGGSVWLCVFMFRHAEKLRRQAAKRLLSPR